MQLLALLLGEKQRSENKDVPQSTLLIVPMSILDNWKREAKKFAPELKLYLHHGSSRLSGKSFVAEANSAI